MAAALDIIVGRRLRRATAMEADILELDERTTSSKLGIHVLTTHPSQRDAFRASGFAQRSGDDVTRSPAGSMMRVPTENSGPFDARLVRRRCTNRSFSGPMMGPLCPSRTGTTGRSHRSCRRPKDSSLDLLSGVAPCRRRASSARTIWHKMLTINAEQVFTIGTINGTQQPVVDQ